MYNSDKYSCTYLVKVNTMPCYDALLLLTLVKSCIFNRVVGGVCITKVLQLKKLHVGLVTRTMNGTRSKNLKSLPHK